MLPEEPYTMYSFAAGKLPGRPHRLTARRTKTLVDIPDIETEVIPDFVKSSCYKLPGAVERYTVAGAFVLHGKANWGVVGKLDEEGFTRGLAYRY